MIQGLTHAGNGEQQVVPMLTAADQSNWIP